MYLFRIVLLFFIANTSYVIVCDCHTNKYYLLTYLLTYLNAARSVMSRMSDGRSFHCCGPATENARYPNIVLIRGTS